MDVFVHDSSFRLPQDPQVCMCACVRYVFCESRGHSSGICVLFGLDGGVGLGWVACGGKNICPWTLNIPIFVVGWSSLWISLSC